MISGGASPSGPAGQLSPATTRHACRSAPGDTLIRDYSDIPATVAAPDATGQLAVIVGCPGEPLCDTDGSATGFAPITVNCPPGITRNAFGQTIYLERQGYFQTEIHWEAPKAFNLVRGCLSGCGFEHPSLRGLGTFSDTIDTCVSSPAPGNSVIDSTVGFPDLGHSYYYLVRGRVAACGATAPGYTSNAASESPGRDAQIDADSVAATCP